MRKAATATAAATATVTAKPSALRWHDAALSALTKWRQCREHGARRAITVCTCARAGRQSHAGRRRGAQCRSNRPLDGSAVGEDPCHYAELVVPSGSCGNSQISCEVIRSLRLSHSGQSRSGKNLLGPKLGRLPRFHATLSQKRREKFICSRVKILQFDYFNQ